MAWSYDVTLSTDKDRIRLMIGDTDPDDAQYSNEELEALATVYGGVHAAAIAAANGLAAKYSRFADKWVGDLKILASQKARNYLALAKTLGAAGVVSRGVPSAGGIRISEKDTMEQDTNRTVPGFTRNQFPYNGPD